ncbi:Aminotransferase-like, plant mobile domain [Sesbania bispinosa]|nr:Aminotransferase-like, plant mobile domain [Sesbania bispinosa]
MVKVRVPVSDSHQSDSSSSSSSDSSVEPLPRSVTSMVWTQLPPPRANPLDATGLKWMDDVKPPVLMRLPLFGDHDASSGTVDSHIIDMAKELKAATIESAKYSREFLARLRADVPSVSDTPQHKVRGTDKKNFIPGPSLPQPLKRAAFLAFWLSKYIFPGPPWESVSSSVFIMACLLAEGVRLPLASLYLGSLYGRLDQIQEQLFSSYEYAPVRSIPDPSRDEKASEPEPRVWGWSMGRPRSLLVDLIDEEDQFLHRPYTQNFFPGVETLHRLYLKGDFATRNVRSSRTEGVYDMWQLILSPQVLPGFIITDTVSIAGGAFWPYIYRPDRVCRQFGIDQPPCSLDLGFCSFSEAMKAVLFRSSDSVTPFDASKFIPPDKSGRVLDLWVAYYARLRNSVKRYEQQDSMQVFPDVKIMCKDPYFVTTASRKTLTTVAATSQPKGKKRKPTASKKPSAASSVSEKVNASPDPSAKKQKSSQSDPIQSNAPKSPRRPAKSRKKVIDPTLPRRSSNRLREKFLLRRVPPLPSSPSHPVEVYPGDTPSGDKPGSSINTHDCIVQDSTSSLVPRAESPRASAEFDHEGPSSPPADDHTAEGVKESLSKEVVCTKGVNSPSASSVRAHAPQLAIPLSSVPPSSTAHSLRSGGMVPLSSLLSEEDARVFSEFIERHPGFMVPDSGLPSAFLKPACALFSEFLRMLQSHSVVELMGNLRERLLGDINALSLFGFKGDWLNTLSCQLAQPVPSVAFEDLGKVTEGIHLLEQRVVELRQQMEAMKEEMDQKVAELEQLKIKEKEITNARTNLDVVLDL